MEIDFLNPISSRFLLILLKIGNNADEKLTVNGNIRTTDTLIATDIDTSFITLDYIEFNNLSSPPSNTTRKLYVVNGNLYFDGNLVSMSII